MQNDETLNNAWYFWNRNFYNRIKPVRKINTKGKGYGPGITTNEVICHDCRKTIPLSDSMRRRIHFYGNKKPKDHRQSAFLCKECYRVSQEDLKKKKEQEYVHDRADKIKKFMNSVERFDDVMFSCENKLCDILAAHRELSKDDPNRLRTDFLLGLICDDEKMTQYLNTRKSDIATNIK